jgi:hypothetical protein
MKEVATCDAPIPKQQGRVVPPSDAPIAENKAVPHALQRHRRKCQICRHPQREEIEQEYRDWFQPAQIARHYQIDDSALYRHLHAIGLVSSRRENLRMILDRILERGVEQPITGETIIRAVRAQCCLQDGNKWVEPSSRVIYQREKPKTKDTKLPISNRECAD